MYKKGFYGGKFLPFHKGHLHCALEASGLVEELHVILFHSGQEEDALLEQEIKFERRMLEPRIREMVIRREFNQFPHIIIHSIDCSTLEQKPGLSSWETEALAVKDIIGDFDVVFSSEQTYGMIFNKLYPNVTHLIVDPDRTAFPISGTMVRTMSAMEAYEYLPRTYQEFLNKKVLIIGTESCGKSTLTKKLAKYFNTSYTVEYARDICIEYGIGNPDISLYPQFIFGQQMAEYEAVLSGNKVVFCDTEAMVTQYYAMLYENTRLEVADAVANTENYDLILYLEPSNRWVDDGLRMHGEEEVRRANDNFLKELIDGYGKEYVVLNGTYEENYLDAIKLVKEILK
jgi:HTH-type transcriptional repressor of NAD biosynthesis genes